MAAAAEDRALLASCREVVAPHDSLSGKDVPLKLARRRYKHLAERFGITRLGLGVTGHGLRHGYIHRRYRQTFGVEVSVRDGDSPRVVGAAAEEAKKEIAEAVGHSRASVISAYTGRAARRN